MSVNKLVTDVCAALAFENAEFLEQGGQKIVLKGTLSGAPAVAKIVPVPVGPNGDITLKRAHREVELLSAVESDRVVKVLTDAIEVGDPTEAVCWAEEYLDGDDLSRSLNRQWDQSEVWSLLGDIAGALAACHSLEVVHRDLSAGNVRKLGDGRFVLMDPGLARHLAKSALTGGFQPGTPGWRSPEHVPGGEPVPASDIFALGILAFYALSGKFPIDPNVAQHDYDLALVETQAPSIAIHVPGVSAELCRIIDTCLDRQPARRYIDGGELQEAIEALGGGR